MRLIQAVLAHHDREHFAGSGCRVLRLSRRALRDDLPPGVSAQDRTRLERIAVVFSDDRSQVVTVVRDRRGRTGRRYRRQL